MLELLKEAEEIAGKENLKVQTVHRSDGKGQGGILKRGIVGGAKGLWSWWNETEEPITEQM